MEPVITPLGQPLASFPHFMPNQVLTHTQLNELAVYLEQQDRFTRQRLVGIGIVCGLQAKLTVAGSTRTVSISKGVGITSCGFLVDIPAELSFTKKKAYTTPADYDPFLLGASNAAINCIELKPDGSTESGISNLVAGDVTDKIVVLFLDLEDKPNGKCVGENCDEKGNKWVFTLRVLLIDRAGANVNSLHNINRVLMESYVPNGTANPLSNDNERQSFFNPDYALPTVFAERFGNMNGGNPAAAFNLDSLTTFTDFENTYRTIILDSATRVANGLYAAYNLFKPVFDTQLLVTSNPFSGFQNPKATNALANKLKDMLNSANGQYRKGNCQYVYDFVLDLIDSYHELRSELFAWSSECSPDPAKFPRHLLLGPLTTSIDFGKFDPALYEPPTVYRNHFIYSPAMNGQSAHLKKVKMLITRISLQINNLSFSGLLQSSLNEEPMMLTPDKSCSSPLGEQRIPFYYSKEGVMQLHRYWNFNYTIQNRAFENRGYWSKFYVPAGLPADLRSRLINPVLYNTCPFNKLAIEGHVGKELSKVIEQLNSFKKQYNLDFDILALKLGNSNGETFIADDALIADIQTLYLAERNEIACCLEDLRDYIEKQRTMIGLFLLFTLYVMVDNPQLVNALVAYLQPVIAQLLDGYVDVINEIIDALTDDIKTFDIQKFLQVFPIFTSFTSLFKYGINTWGDIESFVVDDKGAAPNQFKWMLSDIISVVLNIWELYLDKVSDDCIAGKFYSIYRLYYDRVRNFGVFNRFAAAVPGMEHIAGTTKGGTFILVYTDEEEKKVVTGKLVDDTGAAMANAKISNAETGLELGHTNARGEYSVEVPLSMKKMLVSKAGFVDMIETIGTGRSLHHKMYSYASATTATRSRARMAKMNGASRAFVKIQASIDSIIEMVPEATEYLKAVKLDAAFAHVPKATHNPKQSYRVVADFYLPHPINNYNTRVDTFDACEEIGEVKMIDFGLIAKVLSKETSKSAKEFTRYMFRGQTKADAKTREQTDSKP